MPTPTTDRLRKLAPYAFLLGLAALGLVVAIFRLNPAAHPHQGPALRLEDPAVASSMPGQTLAVLDFADLGSSVELAVLRKALAEMLVGDLSSYQGLKVVERSRVEHALTETNLGEGGLVDETTAQRTGRALAADLVLAGSLAGTEGKVTVKAALARVGEDKPLAEWTLSSATESLTELERDLAGKVREVLGLAQAKHLAPPAPRPGVSPTVAVLGFKNFSPSARLQVMESGFAEILQAELGGLKDLRLVERSKLDAILKEQQLTVAGLVAADGAVKVGRLIGAERLIFGSFVELGPSLHVEARLVDTATASVLRAESAQGPTERFADLFEDLALRLARDLAIDPPPDAPRRIRAGTPTRRLEVALHLATGEELLRQGRYTDSAAAFERVLLLEPDNIEARCRRPSAWFKAMDYANALDAAFQGLSRPFPPEPSWRKEELQGWIVASYWELGRYQEHLEFCQKLLAENPAGSRASHYRIRIAATMMRLNRHEEGVALLKAALAEATAGGQRQLDLETLKTCFLSLFMYTQRSPTSKRDAALAIEIFDRLLKRAEDDRSIDWGPWAVNFLNAVNITYVDEQRRVLSFLTPAQRVDYLQRMLKVFSNRPDMRWTIHKSLAVNWETLGRWKEARESYRYVGNHADDAPRESIPYISDLMFISRKHWLTETIKGRLRAAIMLNDHLGDTPGACAEYQTILRDFGSAHQQGLDLVHSLRNNGLTVAYRKKGALIVGGGADAWKAWEQVLTPLGYAVHPFDLTVVTTANLGVYALVVLVRQGDVPLSPSEVLAFRSYVATGGRLLVIISPGWHHAQPGITNPVLSFFGVQSQPGELPVRVECTELAEHPITRGITGVMAKNGVGLDAPAGAAIVKASGKTLLAALDHQEGRVVAAALGQWFLPNTDHLGDWQRRCALLREGSTPDQLPIESGRGLEIPLLKNVIAWLGEPVPDYPEGRRLPVEFRSVHATTLDVQFRVRPREDLLRLVDELVAAMRSGPRHEEALWTAGEALKSLQWISQSDQLYLAWPSDTGPPNLDPKYFEELVEKFPKSDLRPLAQWEIAEFARINANYRQWRTPNLAPLIPPSDTAADLIGAFERVNAPKGSYAWAWMQVRLAMLNLREDRPEKVLEHARAVADVMVNGPEKILSLLYASLSSERLGQSEQRSRYCRFVIESPDLVFVNDREEALWGPFWLKTESGRTINPLQSTRTIARILDRGTEIGGRPK